MTDFLAAKYHLKRVGNCDLPRSPATGLTGHNGMSFSTAGGELVQAQFHVIALA